jgi:hypothetical protein
MPVLRLLTLAVVFLAFTTTVEAKTDIVIFDNGDRLTGEVKSLEKGLLRFKTEATDTISIEWDNIAYLSSDQNVQVETQEGLRFLGHLLRSEQAYVVTVETSAGPFELDANRVVKMAPIEETAVGRLDGEVLAGYNFTKADQVKQLNLGLDLAYRTELRIFSMDFDATTSDTGQVDSSQRLNLNLDYRRLWPDRWLTTGLVRLTRNDELGIDLRSSIGAGGGRILRQSNSSNFVLEGGLLLSRENVAGGIESNDTVEAFTTLNWNWFRYDLPELDLSSTLTAIPNLTDAGRVRGEFEIVFRWEFIDDFFWRVSFYESYDSDPQDVTAEKNDYGVNTSIAWDF